MDIIGKTEDLNVIVYLCFNRTFVPMSHLIVTINLFFLASIFIKYLDFILILFYLKEKNDFLVIHHLPMRWLFTKTVPLNHLMCRGLRAIVLLGRDQSKMGWILSTLSYQYLYVKE